MPGLVGYTSTKTLSPQQLDSTLQALKTLVTCPLKATDHDILFGPQTAGSIIAPNWQTGRTYQNATGIIAWLDGEIYNHKSLLEQRNWPDCPSIEFLTQILTKPEYHPALKNMDGLFSAVVLDSFNNRLHLITDRYGLRPLYWYHHTEIFGWASEPKAFLKLPHFSPEIKQETATIFLETGQLPPDQCWLAGVYQLPPATHLTYHLTTGKITRERYWWWDQISPRISQSNLDDLADEFLGLFQNAVDLRTRTRQGIFLSGGLDSRAIFAAMPNSPPAFTFGIPESLEVQTAAQVAEIKQVNHTVLPLTHDNWLTPRLEAIWWTDGALNLMHMHGVEHLNVVSESIDTCWNGAGGDGLAGGGHLFEPHKLDEYLRQTLHLNLEASSLSHQCLTVAFQNAKTAHAFYVDWRMRGFTIHGPRLGLFKGIDYVLPFLDNKLQAFLFSLPLNVRTKNKLYHKMLLKAFPSYFNQIPWAKTGKPISASKLSIRSKKLWQKLKKQKAPSNFTDYPSWYRVPSNVKWIESMMLGSNTRIKGFATPEKFENIWEEHIKGGDHTEKIGRYLTMEMYSRQVFDPAFRSQQTMPQT